MSQLELSVGRRHMGVILAVGEVLPQEANKLAPAGRWRGAALRDGKACCIQRQAVYDQPSTPFVARFVGKSTRLTGVVDATGRSIGLDDHEYSLRYVTSELAAGTPVEIFIKNERFDITPWVAGAPGIPCLVQDVVLRGPFFEYILETAAQERIIAVQPKRDEPLSVGAKILLNWDAAKCHVFPLAG